MADVGGGAASVAAPGHLSAADYDRAARVLDSTLRGKVRNAMVAPRWISGRDMFWYRRDGDDGFEFVIVDAQTGAKAEAFDTARLAAALSATAGELSPQPRDLVVTSIDKNLAHQSHIPSPTIRLHSPRLCLHVHSPNRDRRRRPCLSGSISGRFRAGP
jgi:hypothetical protein